MTIKTIDLTRAYRMGSSLIMAVNHVDLRIEEATFVAVVGRSGSGKTTLLNLLGLIDKATSGRILLNGKDTSLMTEEERRRIRLLNIGFVFQTFNLMPTLTALENVELPLMLVKHPQETQKDKATQLLDVVGLSHRSNHRPKELSAGEMQRVAIARALANDPSLVLADEPTGELDSVSGAETVKLLSDLCNNRKKTLIVATHDEKVIKAADVIYRMHDGTITRVDDIVC